MQPQDGGRLKTRNQHGIVRVASTAKGKEGRDHFEQTTREYVRGIVGRKIIEEELCNSK
jgi:hypothetical protein